MAPRIWETVLIEIGRVHDRWESDWRPFITESIGRLRSIEKKVSQLVTAMDDLKGLLDGLGPLLDDLDTVLPVLRANSIDGVTDSQIASLASRLPALKAAVDAFNSGATPLPEPAPEPAPEPVPPAPEPVPPAGGDVPAAPGA